MPSPTPSPALPLPPWSAAAWITGPGEDPQNPQLRTVVEGPAEVTSARLAVTGLGTVRAHLGGREVRDSRLDPGLTDPRARVQVLDLDVTALLSPGRHVLGIELGRGFHALTTPDVWRWEQAPWRGPVRAWALLQMRCTDGSSLEVATGSHWQARPGPITADSMYEGETFEPSGDEEAWLRAEDPGAEGWSAAVTVPVADDGVMVAQVQPPVREQAEIAPRLSSGSADHIVLDMGRVIAGWCRYALAPDLPTGAGSLSFTARHGEKLRADGTVDDDNEHVHTDRFQEDRVRLEAGGARSFAPRHSYKGFRYVQIDRTGGEVDLDRLEVTGILAHADLAPASTLEAEEAHLAAVDAAMRASLHNNMHHVPTDTPMHEKNGWTGDALTALAAMPTSLDTHGMLVKWVADQVDAQRPAGSLAVIAPTPDWGYEELSPAPEWTSLLPVLLEELALEYEDLAPVREHDGAAERYLRHELGRRDEDGLISGVLGDYLSPGSPGPAPEDKRLSASLLVARGLRALARARDLAALPGAEGLDEEAAALEAAVNRVFLDPVRGRYRDPGTGLVRQTSQILPLAAGIVPPEQVQAVVDGLVADLAARGDHHDCGHLGVRFLLPVLSAHGHGALAHRVLGVRGATGWRDWLEAGNGTFMEMWEHPRSCSHYFMGTPVTWIHEHVVGLRRGADGWGAFTLAPDPDVPTGRIALTRTTVRGEITAVVDRPRRTAELTVPRGCRATVVLPDGEHRVEEGRHRFAW